MFGAVGGSNDRHLPDGGESWSRVHVKPKLVIILEYMYLRKYQMYKYINIPYNIIHIPYNIIYIYELSNWLQWDWMLENGLWSHNIVGGCWIQFIQESEFNLNPMGLIYPMAAILYTLWLIHQTSTHIQ